MNGLILRRRIIMVRTVEEIDADLEKYKPLYGKLGSLLAALKKERNEIESDISVGDAEGEVTSEIDKITTRV